MEPGTLLVTLDDSEISIHLVGGGSWNLPVGALTLVDNELERADRPAPEQLTNALGMVTDHFDDVIRASPMVLAPTAVVALGSHVEALARVELGATAVPPGYTLSRADADEVFRTLVSEPLAERAHNPGLRSDEVETIIATCCVVLAIMRRLDLTTIGIGTDASTSTDGAS